MSYNNLTIKESQPNTSGIKTSHRKDKHFYKELLVIAHYKGELSTVVQARFYATNAMHYCCVWVNGLKFHSSGSGSAGGYGYHRESAALEEALNSAGFKFSFSWGGAGSSLMNEALQLVAKKAGYRKIYIHSAHA